METGSLISKCKKDKDFRYVTIKAGKTTEIYFFRFKKCEPSKENQTNRFWWSLITPTETIVVLGAEASRKDINRAHLVTSIYQERTLKLTPPLLTVIGSKDKWDLYSMDDPRFGRLDERENLTTEKMEMPIGA